MTKPQSERLNKKHAFFLSDFDSIQCAVREVRLQCLDDRRFYSVAGAQWNGPVGEQFANKPRFEFNKTHLAVLRVINEYRNNRISVEFIPKDGSEADDTADFCAGAFRADEQDSGAQEAYDNAFEEGTSGGIGAWRLRARYEDPDDDQDDRQRIAIEPIFEADTCVYFSLDGKRQDKADAKRCYVLTSLTPDDYRDQYDDDPTDWPKPDIGYDFDWATTDVVWIAEVYEIEQQEEVIHFFKGIALNDDEPNEKEVTAEELEANPDMLAQLKATGFREVRQKRVKRPKVRKYIMNGNRVLSDEGYIAGKCIPIIPYYGKRWFVDGIERAQGHVRLARDAQMLQNMIMSWLAEMAARFDVEKPILTPEQIAGHAQMWADDAIQKYPYLLVNPITDANGQQMPAGPVAYTKAPNLPPAMAALAQMAAQSLEDMLGNQEAGEQLQQNQSGIATELIQQRLDMQTFIYVDNFKKAMKRSGEVWISMAKDLMVEPGRKMKTVDANGEATQQELMQPMVNKETGESYSANDLTKAKFDVSVEAGPSSSSKKAATVRAVSGMIQMTQDPEMQMVLTSTALMNMEGEGLGELKPYFRKKLLNVGAVKPTEDEQKEMEAAQQQQAQQPPDANTQYLIAAAQSQAADAQNKQATAGLTMAKIDQTQALTEKTRADAIVSLHGIDQAKASHTLAVVQHLDDQAMQREQMQQQQAAAEQQAQQPQPPAQ